MSGGSGVRVIDGTPWPALLVRDGEAWISVHSRRDPRRDAARQLDAVDAVSSSVLFVVGLGLGYLLDVLEERGWTGKVVALEPDPALAGAFRHRQDRPDWSRDGRLTVLEGPAYDGLDRLMPSLAPNRADLVAVVNPVIARLWREATEDALRRAAAVWFGARANQEARRQNAGRYLLNTLRNAASIAREGDAAALAGRFSGVPAVLVAAGPSLDRNLAEIAAYRDRVILIAVDTALRPLLRAGIEPDLVVAVDPTEANARHLAELPPCPRTHFVAEGSLDPEALPCFAGRTFFFRVTSHHPWPWLRQNGIERGTLRAWGSVLTTAFDLALVMGCNPIAFTGADLAFTGGRPYARGTTYEEEWAREQAWGQTLEDSWSLRVGGWPDTYEPGVSGAAVRTAPHLRSFRDWIAAEAEKGADRTIVNATPGGILVGGGIVLRSLEATVGRLAPLPAEARSRIADRHRASARADTPLAPPTIGHLDLWATTTPLDRGALVAAIERTWTDPAASPPGAPEPVDRPVWWSDVPASTAAGDRRATSAAGAHPGLSERDGDYLGELSTRGPCDLLAVHDPRQDVLAALRDRTSALPPGGALVVIDELGTSVGTQVRRAVDALLCERPDLAVEHRRFVDRASRLSVLRPAGSLSTTDALEADAEKWHPDHRAVAARLAPLLAEHFTPSSVVDVGCGAGYWLDAFAATGVADLCGITPYAADLADTAGPRPAGGGRALVRAPLDAVPPAGRRYDLCLCLEVAHRMTRSGQGALIERCVQLSDVVIFSSRPPGSPGGGPHDRPLRYWAELFWRHGCVLDASIREQVERRWSLAQSFYDGLVTFRRIGPGTWATDAELTAFALDAVTEQYEQWWQKIWWTVAAADRDADRPTAPEYPRTRLTAWVLPRVRMAAWTGNGRVFRFRSDAARLYLTHPSSCVALLEDGRPMDEHGSVERLAAASGWARWRDEITIKPADGSDPRTNGREYALVVPADVAWLESQPLAIAGAIGSAG